MKLGEMLLGNGIITHDQLEQALDIQEREGVQIGMILVRLKCITIEQLTEYLKVLEKQ